MRRCDKLNATRSSHPISHTARLRSFCFGERLAVVAPNANVEREITVVSHFIAPRALARVQLYRTEASRGGSSCTMIRSRTRYSCKVQLQA
eukprot:3233139-Prymnesium_polylepis.1